MSDDAPIVEILANRYGTHEKVIDILERVGVSPSRAPDISNSRHRWSVIWQKTTPEEFRAIVSAAANENRRDTLLRAWLGLPAGPTSRDTGPETLPVHSGASPRITHGATERPVHVVDAAVAPAGRATGSVVARLARSGNLGPALVALLEQVGNLRQALAASPEDQVLLADRLARTCVELTELGPDLLAPDDDGRLPRLAVGLASRVRALALEPALVTEAAASLTRAAGQLAALREAGPADPLRDVQSGSCQTVALVTAGEQGLLLAWHVRELGTRRAPSPDVDAASIVPAEDALLELAPALRERVQATKLDPGVAKGDFEGIDGDSAGAAHFVALCAALSRIAPLRSVAFTGAVRLQALPPRPTLRRFKLGQVGGLRDKVRAVVESGPWIETIVVPPGQAADANAFIEEARTAVRALHDLVGDPLDGSPSPSLRAVEAVDLDALLAHAFGPRKDEILQALGATVDWPRAAEKPPVPTSPLPSWLVDRSARPTLVYVADTADDRVWVDKLLKHLKPLQAAGRLAPWSRQRSLRPGSSWAEERDAALDAAGAVVLVVSTAVLGSDDLRDYVMPRVLARGVPILPLPVEHCLHDQATFRYVDPHGAERSWALTSAEPASPWETPLSSQSLADQDAVLVKLVRRLLELSARPGAALATAAPTTERRYLDGIADYLGRLRFQQGKRDLLAPLELGGPGPRDRTLGTLAIELELIEDRAAPAPREVEGPYASRRGSLRELLTRTDPGRLVVLGEPGAGKTTLLRQVAWELACEPDPPWLPVFVRLPDWDGGDPLAHAARAWTKLTGHDVAPLLTLARARGRVLLLLDGLDEVSADRAERCEAVRMLADDPAWARCPLVVTTRTVPYRREELGAGFGETSLVALDCVRRDELLQRLFAGTPWADGARRVEALLATSPEELRGNPLYVTLVALLVARSLERGETFAATTRAGLLGSLIDVLLQGRGHSAPDGARLGVRDAANARTLLRHLAYALTTDEPKSPSRDELAARVRGLREAEGLLAPWRPTRRGEAPAAEAFLDDVAAGSGILQPDEPNDRYSPWGWWHRTLREVLTAEALATGGPELWLVQAKALEDAPAATLARWAEPFALLAGRVTEPDALIEALADANSELGLRALATAGSRVSDATLQRVLGLSDGIEARGRVYFDLAAQAGRAEDQGAAGAALDLLERLWAWVRARGKEYGDDLYFLDEAISCIGVQCKGVSATEVKRRRDALYAAIPLRKADRERFEWVEVQGRRVPLWTPIPAGSFLMGSPSTEEGRHESEGPQHRVKVDGFELWRTPVTNAQYRAFDPGHKGWFEKGVSDAELVLRPVTDVSWFAATAFCRWLSAQGLGRVRLPSEAEWEYATRGGTTTRFWWGDRVEDLARVGGCYRGLVWTRRVGELSREGRAHPFELCHLHQGVGEWMQDNWHETYQGAPTDGSAWECAGAYLRVLRGSRGWSENCTSLPRAARRMWSPPGHSDPEIGLRPAR